MPLTTRTFSSPNLRGEKLNHLDKSRSTQATALRVHPKHHQSDSQHLASFDEDTDDEEFYVIGDRVFVDGYRPGSVAYFGETEFASGDWVGVVLDEPTGNHDGKLIGREYFQCAPNHGIFVRTHRVSRIPDDHVLNYSRASSRTPTPLPTYQHPLRFGASSNASARHGPMSPLSRSSSRSPAASSLMDSYYYDDDYRRERIPTVESLSRKLNSMSQRHRDFATSGAELTPSVTPRTGILKRPAKDGQTQTYRPQSVESQYSSGYSGSGANSNRNSARLSSSQSDGLNGTLARPSSASPHGNQFAFRPRREPISSVDKSTYTADDYRRKLRRPTVDVSSEPPERGDRVVVKTDRNGGEELVGILRFMGETSFATGEWAGVELDDPVGKNNGSILGQRYFYCPQNYGLFVPARRVRKLDRNDYKYNYERPSVFESVRSTFLSPPPPSKGGSPNRLVESASTTPSYDPDVDSRPDTSSPYIRTRYTATNPQHQRPQLDSSRSTLNTSSTSSAHDLDRSSSLDKFDEQDLDREIRKSLDKATRHSWTSNFSSPRAKGVTYTFMSNELDGNPIACKTLLFD